MYVSIDKSLLGTLNEALIVANLLIALVFGALLIGWLRLKVRRMTEPLSLLASLMSRASEGESGMRATVRGPAETQAIAKVFNLMIEKIEHNKELLESEVAIRTLELWEARDAALTASRLKSEFLSILTHEIRTPLTPIKGHTELAIRDLRFIADTDDIIERLDVVLGTGREMLEIIDRILEYARAEAGKTELQCNQIYLPDFVPTMATSLQPMVLKNHNELHMQLEGESVVRLDEGKLIVIMHNLLTNACKYTADGHIELQVHCGADKLSIVVADTGIGIPEDQHKLIFEPFNQVDKSNRRTYSGVGLGLAISKRFCEMLGGSMTVRSRIGCGSMFSADIPLPMARGPPVPPA